MARHSKSNWSVLILCTGFGNEPLRSIVETTVAALGFDPHVYDLPGYPIDPILHSHAACVKAIPSHDIVLAFADESEGGEFQVGEVPRPMIEDLRNRNIIPHDGSTDPLPTIFQVEVLTARSLGKPTIAFIPNDVKDRVDQTIKMLRANELNVVAKSTPSPNLQDLIKDSNWGEIQRHFEVPVGRIVSFRQLVFLERLRKERPNFISYYDLRDLSSLASHIKSRLEGTVEFFIKEHVLSVNSQIELHRDPLRPESLQDLINRRLIISSPFERLSGQVNEPLFSDVNETGGIATVLKGRKGLLLLGNPGLGKTTACLLTFRELVDQAGSEVEGLAPLYASWRTLLDLQLKNTEEKIRNDDFIRLLIGLPLARPPWPKQLHLPGKHWILVLDGLDESPLERNKLVSLVTEVTENATVLLSCREYDYKRHLQTVRHHFNAVIKLLPWESNHIREYLEALRVCGKFRAAEFIDEYLKRNVLPDFISVPLWLSVLTYLAERPESRASVDMKERTDYELLRMCADAVADDELNRHGAIHESKEGLIGLWEQSAWELQRARREKQIVRIADLEHLLDIEEGSPLGRSVFTLLDILGDHVSGFFHQVFQEFWLAEFLVNRLIDGDLTAKERAEFFSYQRSVITNRFIRRRIRSRESISLIGYHLREAFKVADKIPERALFAKNQLVYFLGRIDTSDENLNFLSTVWNSRTETPFVKHSAAFGAIILGDEKIEREYYGLLSTSADDDQMNRGYHLYYYGGVDARESEMPIMDTGQGDSDGTLRRLFERLSETERRYLNLRRIEMFTVRRFLETGRTLPEDIQDSKNIIAKAASDVQSHDLSDDFINGVRTETDKLIALLP